MISYILHPFSVPTQTCFKLNKVKYNSYNIGKTSLIFKDPPPAKYPLYNSTPPTPF